MNNFVIEISYFMDEVILLSNYLLPWISNCNYNKALKEFLHPWLWFQSVLIVYIKEPLTLADIAHVFDFNKHSEKEFSSAISLRALLVK